MKTDDDDVDLDDPSNQLIEKLGHDQSLTICSHIDLTDDDDDDTYHNGKRTVSMDNIRNPPSPSLPRLPSVPCLI